MKLLPVLEYEHLKRSNKNESCLEKDASLNAKSLLHRFEIKVVFQNEDGGILTGDYGKGKTVATLKKIPTGEIYYTPEIRGYIFSQ